MSQIMQNDPEDQTPQQGGMGSNVTSMRGSGSAGSRAPQGFMPRETFEMSNPSREEIDAKLSATEARIETTMARMDARIDSMAAKLDSAMALIDARLAHLPSTWQLIITVLGGVVASAGLSIAVLTYGGDKFDSGALITTQIMETRALADENAKQIKDVSERLDALPGKLLDAIEKRNRVDQVPSDGGAQ